MFSLFYPEFHTIQPCNVLWCLSILCCTASIIWIAGLSNLFSNAPFFFPSVLVPWLLYLSHTNFFCGWMFAEFGKSHCSAVKCCHNVAPFRALWQGREDPECYPYHNCRGKIPNCRPRWFFIDYWFYKGNLRSSLRILMADFSLSLVSRNSSLWCRFLGHCFCSVF